jgi:hypothetical protein
LEVQQTQTELCQYQVNTVGPLIEKPADSLNALEEKVVVLGSAEKLI